MALMIDLKHPDWVTDEALKEELLEYYPEADIRTASDPGDIKDIIMLTACDYSPGDYAAYPNLKVIQKTGAGVNNIMADKNIPVDISITRLETHVSGNEMAEYALAYVLQEQRQIRAYHQHQRDSEWCSYPPLQSHKTTVAIMGLGRIGALIAQRFVDNRFNVVGWSRSQKDLPNVKCYSGDELSVMLAEADYVISVLPATEDTKYMFNLELFGHFKPSAFFINVGRGDLVNEKELMQALDNEELAGAILDVVCTEPMPSSDPLWQHPKVQITPHISGYHLGDAVKGITENYRRLLNNEPLINMINRELGY